LWLSARIEPTAISSSDIDVSTLIESVSVFKKKTKKSLNIGIDSIFQAESIGAGFESIGTEKSYVLCKIRTQPQSRAVLTLIESVIVFNLIVATATNLFMKVPIYGSRPCETHQVHHFIIQLGQCVPKLFSIVISYQYSNSFLIK